jgi:hypothetical protein
MNTVVSITSYGERLSKTLPKTLESIYGMTGFKPDAVLLYLTEQDYGLLDKNLMFKHPKLSVRITDDIRSYKKYLALTEREFDKHAVFIADDDILYSPDTWLTLSAVLGRHDDGNVIYAKTISVPKRGFLSEYRIPVRDTDTAFGKYWLWTNNGVLVPPETFRFDEQVLRDGFDTAPTDDDAFMSVYCNTSGVKCRCIYGTQAVSDFSGNPKLRTLNRGAFRTHLQQSLAHFGHPDADTIAVSVHANKPSADRMESLFGQSLRPDKVFLYVPESYKPTKRMTELTERHSVTLIKSDNPSRDRWTPDTDPDDLVFFIDDTEHGRDLIESMYTEYYKSPTNGSMQRRSRLAYIPSFGHRHLVNPSRAVIRRKHLDGLTLTDDTELSVTETVLRNTLVFNKPRASFQQA